MKDKLALLITCTYLELATAIGVTGYLLYLDEPVLALISGVVFSKVIIFHAILDHYDGRSKNRKNTCMECR